MPIVKESAAIRKYRPSRRQPQYADYLAVRSKGENHDYTVDMDPRFVDGYNRCWSSLNSKGEELRSVFAAAQPGGAQRMLFELMAVGKGMQKFFADNGGKSAATRQLNENFLRAI